MYRKYWNLRESPFLNTDNENLVYPSEQLKEGVARLYYLVEQERNAGILTGPYGVGKTFLLSCLVSKIAEKRLPLIRFDAIPSGTHSMARHILESLGIKGEAPSMADALMMMQRRAMESRQRPIERHVLLIDEAQYLADSDGLYLIHFLSNLRIHTPSGDKPLFTVILAGIPSLAESVKGYESLQRRIQLSWQLRALDEEQTIEYVQHHMRAAGGDIWSFTLDALRLVHRFSQGLPRNINNICDTALMLGFAAREDAVSVQIAEQAALDTGLAE